MRTKREENSDPLPLATIEARETATKSDFIMLIKEGVDEE